MYCYKVVTGTGTAWADVNYIGMDNETTDYGAVLDALIDSKALKGERLYTFDEVEEMGLNEDEYISGGNNGLCLIHYGEFQIFPAGHPTLDMLNSGNMGNIGVDNEIQVESDHLNFEFNTCFDVDAFFGTETENTEDWVNLYADYYPEDKRIEVTYIIDSPDGDESHTYNPTETEKQFLLELMEAKVRDLDFYDLDDMWRKETAYDRD